MKFISRGIAVSKLFLTTHGPALMVGGGVVVMAAGAVVGAKNTLYLEEVLAPHVEKLDQIKHGQSLSLDGYTDEHAQSDRFKVYSRAAISCGRLYAVPTIIFGAGCALVFKGHQIQMRRNATLALAFTGLKQSYDAYRGRVREEFGNEVDQAMLSGYISKEVIDPETGDVKTINTRDWDGHANGDPYNRIFEQGASKEWVPDLGVNKMFVGQQQRFAQQLLVMRGHLYLSDVYKSLGFDESPLSRLVGWKVQQLPDGSKDIPFVDFGLDKAMPDDWTYSQNKAIYLDFNCSGLIIGGDVQKIMEKA